MTRRLIVVLSMSAILVSLVPHTALGDPIAIVEHHVYRVGVFLVVDALVANKTTQRTEAVEATVEFHDFFGGMKRVEHTRASPPTLGPSQVGALRVVTPYSDGVRRLVYRFTWWQNGAQCQAVVRRDIWTIGSVIRPEPRGWTRRKTAPPVPKPTQPPRRPPPKPPAPPQPR